MKRPAGASYARFRKLARRCAEGLSPRKHRGSLWSGRRHLGLGMPSPGKVGGGLAAARGARPAGGIGPRGAHDRAPAPTVPRAGPGVTVPARPEPAAARYATHPLRSAESFSEIVLASASEFPYSTSSHGGVAQLGERLTGSQEVRGSIPLVSTRALNEAPTQVGAFFLFKD